MAQHIVIIGNGVAGITVARHVRKRQADARITVISAETEHFFSRPALMYIYMGHMRYQDTKPYEDWFWGKNRIDLRRGWVTRVDAEAQRVHLEGGDDLAYDKLVLATGSQSNRFGWDGQDLPGVQGLYSYQDVELMEHNTRGVDRAVIVGGGLIGIEVAEMLLSRRIAVTFLVREEEYWDNILPKEEARLIGRHARAHGIDLRLATNLERILPGADGRAAAVITDRGERIPCGFVALTPGVHPNVDLAKTSGIEVGRGVLVDEYLETPTRHVHAVGDCAEIVDPAGGRNRIEQLWYTGRLQGIALAATLCGERTRYQRGTWYNSAKFLDVEYQTYGFVANVPREDESSFYWETADGRHSARIVFGADDEEVRGCNFMGIRQRQDVWQDWIAGGQTADHVLAHLREASFDPELFRRYEPEIVAAYNRDRSRDVRLQPGAGHGR